MGPHQPHVFHRAIVNEVLAECQTSALQKIDRLIVMENKAPFTLHEPDLAEYRDRFLKSYREARVPQLRMRAGNVHLKPDELAALDSHDPALRYMASARAYFRGSYRIFVFIF